MAKKVTGATSHQPPTQEGNPGNVVVEWKHQPKQHQQANHHRERVEQAVPSRDQPQLAMATVVFPRSLHCQCPPGTGPQPPLPRSTRHNRVATAIEPPLSCSPSRCLPAAVTGRCGRREKVGWGRSLCRGLLHDPDLAPAPSPLAAASQLSAITCSCHATMPKSNALATKTRATKMRRGLGWRLGFYHPSERCGG
jgi:hypothetical protein